MGGTINRLFQESTRRFAGLAAQLEAERGERRPVSYEELGSLVRRFALGLRAMGVGRGDAVALLSENRPWWAVADLGIIHAGGVCVALFPTLPAAQVRHILADSGAKVLVVSDGGQLSKALEARRTLPGLGLVVMDSPSGRPEGVLRFDDVLAMGAAKGGDGDFAGLWRSVRPGDRASIIYTSGTTGEPKGAVLTHGNFVSNVEAAQAIFGLRPGDVMLSTVPLNHVMGRMADHYLPLTCGASVSYVDKIRRIREKMVEVRPHYMVLVPRLLELFHEGLVSALAKESYLKRRLFEWALSVGGRSAGPAGEKAAAPLRTGLARRLADRLVFSSVRRRLGIDRLRFFISGSAPLALSTARFFRALGIPVLEGYGLSETSPLVAINRPGRERLGTVGEVIEGVEVKIADDGEILVRGPNVMEGYHRRPEETARAVDAQGWFHTGDVGEIDERGFLRITDRKKDLIVLSNGKKVAPQPIENRLRESRYISQALLLGDGASTVAALVAPDFDAVRRWLHDRGGEVPREDPALAASGEVRALMRSEIDRACRGLAEYEKVRRFALLERDLSVESGEMTPTLKLRRRVVMERYRHLVDSLFR
ncbi:MAG TPA: long-chain fatty acid--CoA ligase [Deltaproteobacteria bacterium]|nr:long-chain fatty acid--CoA ligase [Deltaproteobacteria bacterium]